jgi:alkaline phosphatase D
VLGSAATAAWVLSAGTGRLQAAPLAAPYPFTLGVASGEPSPSGVVLWTRVASRPLEPGGGMPAAPVAVWWEVAEDDAFSAIVRSGNTVASPQWGHTVHVEVEGLRPERWYWYRFKAAGHISPTGRTRTLPPAGATPERLRFAFASCQHYEDGLFTAYEHLARENLDLVVHLGDYIYEGAGRDGSVRRHLGGELTTLDEYRIRYALYRLDPALQAAHACAPWVVTWDDHEVANNYAGDIPARPATLEAFRKRRAAAYQAYYESMPLRRAAVPRGPDMLLYRRLAYGRLASFHVLDTRQYRTDQPQGDGRKPPSDVLLDPAGTLLGEKQREWLFDGLERSPAAWNVLAQQVMMARVDRAPGAAVELSMDQWSGYEYERRRLLRHLRDRSVRNPVVLTGDIHCNWANELAVEAEPAPAENVAVEFVGTSISSNGDGLAVPKWAESALAENPFVKFVNQERGYVRCEVTPEHWTTDYRTVPYVSRPGAPIQTRATFVVNSGRSQLRRVEPSPG